jgi:1-acyl-sn-glycerol-3-phosphate acyltransferase
MILFRSLVFFVYFVITILFFGTMIFTVAWISPFEKRFILDRAWSRSVLYGLKQICRLDYQIEGFENLPDGNAIFLSKHQSAWETISLINMIPAPRCWVLKKELLHVPVFGWAMRHYNPIAINRKASKQAVKQVITQGMQRLKSGSNLIIFPEGTRTAPGERRTYHIGGALLAAKSDYPVIPIAHNAGVFWKRRGFYKYPGTIQVKFGPVMKTEGLSATEINRRVEEWIEAEQEKLPIQP